MSDPRLTLAARLIADFVMDMEKQSFDPDEGMSFAESGGFSADTVLAHLDNNEFLYDVESILETMPKDDPVLLDENKQ